MAEPTMDDKTSLAACTTSGGKKPTLPSRVMDGLILLLALGVVLVEEDEDDILLVTSGVAA
jgi:hypothetical protein